MTTGYSGTPLAKKLGIKEGSKVYVLDAPDNYQTLLAPLPAEVQFVSKLSCTTQIMHVFVDQKTVLEKALKNLRQKMPVDSMIWVSWPKKASKVPTDVTEDVIREIALPLGLVDIKVCAVSEVWSGLKLMLRKELR
jgi:hypothetical protein